MTIRRSQGGGFEVRSKKGKKLSGKGLTLEEAEKRLRQIEFFKHRKVRQRRRK